MDVGLKIRRRDRKFVAFVAANAVCIAAFIAGGVGSEAEAPGGWRRVDLKALKAKIQAGKLVKHEADWYRVVPEEER